MVARIWDLHPDRSGQVSAEMKSSVILPDSELVAIRREFGPTFEKIALSDDRIVAVDLHLEAGAVSRGSSRGVP